jgi:hypothetical protein
MLAELGHQVTLVAWRYAEVNSKLPVIRVDDVLDYCKKVMAFQADAYILAGAVANLMPSNPYPDKFPSHNYKVGDKFNVEFEIAPRVIDDIKKKYPRSTLIGYKLLDGTDEALIQAGKKTLFESKANIVFANHPAWAKEKKFAITQDGAVFECSFDEHVHLIDKLVRAEFYKTEIVEFQHEMNDVENQVVHTYPTHEADGRVYGCFAVRRDVGFLTTTRGKKAGREAVSYVIGVDHEAKKITATERATLNAPLLERFLQLNPKINILLHGHKRLGAVVHDSYEFAGSDGDLNFASPINNREAVYLNHHGYIVGFETLEDYRDFVNQEKLETK